MEENETRNMAPCVNGIRVAVYWDEEIKERFALYVMKLVVWSWYYEEYPLSIRDVERLVRQDEYSDTFHGLQYSDSGLVIDMRIRNALKKFREDGRVYVTEQTPKRRTKHIIPTFKIR